MSIPVITMDVTTAQEAWAAHKALLEAEQRNPGLTDNPVWQTLRMDAYEAFYIAFEGKAA